MSDLSDEAIRAYAANIFDLEDAREEAQTDLKEAWAGIRNAHGKQFADSLKLAVKRARMDQGKRDAADQIDAEADRIFALLSAPSRVARGARTYEAVDHDPITGEIADETPMSNASGQPGGDDPETPDDAASAGETANPRASRNGADGTSEGQGATGAGTEGATPSTGSKIDEPDAAMRPQTAGSETAVANSTPGSGAGTVDAGGANWPSEMTTASPANEPETIPPVADPATVVSEAGVDRSAGTASATVVAFRINTKTHFANSKGLPRLHGCLKPEACGGSHRSLCFGCSVQHDGPAHHEGAA